MKKTTMTIQADKFLINGKLTYREIENCQYQGLLMNARFIQAIYDDKTDITRYNRFGKTFDPTTNTQEFIHALPAWYETGLRAFTVGFQGGGPCYTIDLATIKNNPFGTDGKKIDPEYLERLAKIIDAADELGMIVIVSLFYGMQTQNFESCEAVESATRVACKWLKERGDKNVIIEIANEHDVETYAKRNVLFQENGIIRLIEMAQATSGGMPVGCSGRGGYFSKRIAEASDVILIHGNSLTRNQLYNLIKKAKAITPTRPIVINEDSQALSQMAVAFQNGVSWGYYNNMTKQEPPVNWGITKGEDQFFAIRMKEFLTGEKTDLPLEDQFYLQGLEEEMVYEGKRFIRLASLYPELTNYVEFFRNEELYEIAYDDPFCINFLANWNQLPVKNIQPGEIWKAVITLIDGRKIEKKVVVK